MSFDKKEYQRAYMRKKREKNLPASVLTETGDVPVTKDSEENTASIDGEARESTNTKLKRSVEQVASEPRGGQSFCYDKKKYPNRKAWEIAVQRSEACKRYAEKFSELIRANDLQFQTVDWWYEKVKASCK